jgi:hypothetical protein
MNDFGAILWKVSKSMLGLCFDIMQTHKQLGLEYFGM